MTPLKRVGVPDAFMFFTDNDEYTGVFAVSLLDLYAKLEKIPAKSLEFHAQRSDFVKWTGRVLGDSKLAGDLSKLLIHKDGETLRMTLRGSLRERLKELGQPV